MTFVTSPADQPCSDSQSALSLIMGARHNGDVANALKGARLLGAIQMTGYATDSASRGDKTMRSLPIELRDRHQHP